MSAAPTVSAVIPTYNRRRELGAAVASALGQSAPLHELVIVDDGSEDGTWEELQALARREGVPRIVLHRQANAGPSAARNAGVRLATGDFIAFLDSDDRWHEQKTARQLALFAREPELALVGCAADILCVFPGRSVVPIDVGHLLFRNYLLTPGVMARRNALAEAGGFAEDLRHCEDLDLWLRIVSRRPCALLNEILVTCGDGKHPFGESGLSGELWQQAMGEREALRRWRGRGGAAFQYWRSVLLFWLRFARRAAIAGLRRLSGKAA